MTTRLVLANLLGIGRVNANFLVVLLKGSKILAGLGELTLLHTLTDIPVYEGALGVKKVELVVEAAPRRRDGGSVGKHAHRARDLREIAARDVRWRLVADTDLETSRAPVDELDRALGLDQADSGVCVLRNDIAAVEQSASHYDDI